jgi:polar amino acid transport system substrate-binding protein
MVNARKLMLLVLSLVLALGVVGLVGCSSEEKSEEPTTTTQIKSVDDLKEGDKVGVQSGTTGEEWAKTNLEPKGVEVVPYDDILLAFSALQAGDIVGVVNDLPISQDIVKDETRGLEVVQEIQTDEAYGFAFNKSDTALRDGVNWALAKVIADGQYDTIYEKWFGSPPMSMPAEEVTVAEKPATISTLQSGKIIVGSDTAFPPFENVEGAAVVGFDVDLMNAIGEQLGLTVEFKSYKFDALITGVQAGTEFDMIASAMTITDERKQSVDFSNPYINSNQSLAVKKAQ